MVLVCVISETMHHVLFVHSASWIMLMRFYYLLDHLVD